MITIMMKAYDCMKRSLYFQTEYFYGCDRDPAGQGRTRGHCLWLGIVVQIEDN